jgi:FMN phosphatase YigB (HAD superfamily)
MLNHPNPYQIQAILFDWDLTLGAALGDVSLGERVSALFKRVGLDYDSQAIMTAMHQRRRAIEQGQLQGQLVPQEKAEIILYYQQLLTLLGHSQTSPQLAERIYTNYAYLPFVFYQDTLPTLQRLAASGLRMGIITNHTPHIRPIIEEKLQNFVSPGHIIISGELNIYKPDPAIFAEATARLEIPAEQCIYVGDNLEVDAIGAVTAGKYGCGLWCDRANRPIPASLPAHVYRITRLDQILGYISRYAQ